MQPFNQITVSLIHLMFSITPTSFLYLWVISFVQCTPRIPPSPKKMVYEYLLIKQTTTNKLSACVMRIHGHLFHMDHSSNWKWSPYFKTLEFVPICVSKDIKRDKPLPAKVLCFHYYLKGCSPQPIVQLFYHCSKSLWPSPPCLKHLKTMKCQFRQKSTNW